MAEPEVHGAEGHVFFQGVEGAREVLGGLVQLAHQLAVFLNGVSQLRGADRVCFVPGSDLDKDLFL